MRSARPLQVSRVIVLLDKQKQGSRQCAAELQLAASPWKCAGSAHSSIHSSLPDCLQHRLLLHVWNQAAVACSGTAQDLVRCGMMLAACPSRSGELAQ